MKKYRPSLAILFLAALAAGCGKSSTDNGAAASPPSGTETQASETETQAPSAVPQPTGSTATANGTTESSGTKTQSPSATGSDSTANTTVNSTIETQPAMAASPTATTGDPAVSQSLTPVKPDGSQTAQDLKAYTYEQKDELVQTLQSEIDKLNQDLLQLTAKTDVAGDSIKAAAQPKLAALKTQVSALGIYLNAVKNATAATWDEVKADAQKASDEATQAFQDARQWIDQQVNH